MTVLALLSYFVLPTVVTAAATAVVTAVVVRRMFERRMIAFGDQIEALVAEVRTSRGEQQDVSDQQQDVLDHDRTPGTADAACTRLDDRQVLTDPPQSEQEWARLRWSCGHSPATA